MNLNEYLKLQEKVIDYVEPRIFLDKLPTIRELADKFEMKQADMLELVEDTQDLHCNVGFQIQGFGTHEDKRIGDYTVEYYE